MEPKYETFLGPFFLLETQLFPQLLFNLEFWSLGPTFGVEIGDA